MHTDTLLFFNEHEDAIPMYEKLEALIMKQIPEAKIKVSKTQISFSNKRGFAIVSFNSCRKVKDRPKVWMTVTFDLGYQKISHRIDVATEAHLNRWTHHVMVSGANDIDNELMSWICEAAEFAASKK